jgi:hypothetical protein
MNKFNKITFRLIAVTQILALTLLASCTTVGKALNTSFAADPSTACHATGDASNPYEEITITNDINPVPASGCPTGPVLLSDGKITICHATGSEANPYNEITVNVNGLDGHGTHEGDIFPATEGGCPVGSGALNGDVSTTVCHATGDATNPYEEVAVNSTELKEHNQHPDDINPVPVNGCPDALAVVDNGKITICHVTGSETNPYNEITISVNGLNGHGAHDGDLIPMPADGCPLTLTGTSTDKITICHATGSKTNPYNEITISINGLSGHNKHEGDIIPAPESGCPVTRP